ncbi:hypothetical protein STCU_10268 [Strigomonas culicis]|uniref:Uncharacterized protein n=1 Tax=Strigomonas culicis TaxID=28005 RepID=S9TIT7_9TRYP|nr:hypothetical protein STCU_10268 [Strigomonas culicis]|eukprot:EPY17997.1 hypothetical protein STCU_10268 [Strigomonas culicis]
MHNRHDELGNSFFPPLSLVFFFPLRSVFPFFDQYLSFFFLLVSTNYLYSFCFHFLLFLFLCTSVFYLLLFL